MGVAGGGTAGPGREAEGGARDASRTLRDESRTPRRFFLLASLLFGAALGLVTPPLHVPDEQAHLYRAYRVSEGHLDLLPERGRHAQPLPRSLFDFADAALGEVRFQPQNRFPGGALGRLARVPLAPGERVPVLFPQTLQYTFVPYVVPAAAIFAGRMADAGPLALLYLARAANLLFGTVAVLAALRLLPAMRWWLVALALTPMAVALRASVSADVLGMSAAVVLIAGSWRLASGDERARPARLAAVTAAAVLLCAGRPPYAALALLPLLARGGAGVRLGAWRAAHLTLAGLATAWGFATAMRVGFTREGTGIDPARQLDFALAHPITAFEAVLRDVVANAPRYLAQAVGKLGWLDTALPVAVVALYLVLLLALLAVDGRPGLTVPAGHRLTVLACLAATILAIGGSQYLVWAPVGAERIPDGIQGRYFLPLALTLPWLAHRPPPGAIAWPRVLPRVLAAVVTVVAAVTLRAVWRRYYG